MTGTSDQGRTDPARLRPRRFGIAVALLALFLQWLSPIGLVAAAAGAAPQGFVGPICTVDHGGGAPDTAPDAAHAGCSVCCQAVHAAGLISPPDAVWVVPRAGQRQPVIADRGT